MAKMVFTNNASSLLAASITDSDLSLQVASGEGALFPSPGASEYFVIALVNSDGDLEICHCTSRTGDLLTIERAKEGTTAQAWTNGQARVELRLTAGVMGELLQKAGDSMEGDLDMGDNSITNARLDAPVVEGGQLVGTSIRGTEDDSSNEIVVPSDGSRATAGGSAIVTEDDDFASLLPVGSIIMWYGSLLSLPEGWALCDGTGGTPDLRGKFIVGAGGSYNLGDTGGSATASGNTSSDGAHTHSVSVAGHALTESELPAHSHRLLGATSALVDIPVGAASAQVVGAGRGAAGQTYVQQNNSSDDLVEDTGDGSAHTHTATTGSDGAHTHSLSSISTLPPYTAVYYIMKVS